MKRVFVGMLACMMVLGLLVSGAALADTPTGTPVSTWKELSDALREGTESAYYLTKDLYDSTNYGIMVVPNGRTVTLDLNGYIMDRGVTAGRKNGMVFKVSAT